MSKFDLVEEYLEDAKGIAWDECHKIYILMDDEQLVLMREYGYDKLITHEEATPSEMLDTVWRWYEDSCGLRFVQAVATAYPDRNDGFTDLIAQGEGDEDDGYDDNNGEDDEDEEDN
jgi:hypothetical protein